MKKCWKNTLVHRQLETWLNQRNDLQLKVVFTNDALASSKIKKMISNARFLPTYIINLKRRSERLYHVQNEFTGKTEFKTTIVEAVEDIVGAAGLWMSMIKIINMAVANNEDVIVICEDDHRFTENYNKDFLFKNIVDAHHQGADILCGGISGGYNHVFPLTKNRFWIDRYSCNQFIIVYKKFFKVMLDTQFDRSKKVDQTLSDLTSNKMVLYPFVSEQKYFGYSDVTKKNQDNPDWAQNRFALTSEKLKVVQQVYIHYHKDLGC